MATRVGVSADARTYGHAGAANEVCGHAGGLQGALKLPGVHVSRTMHVHAREGHEQGEKTWRKADGGERVRTSCLSVRRRL